MTQRCQVAVQTPAHSAVGGLLSYTHTEALPPGTLVRVPLGQRELLGVVWDDDLPGWAEPAEPIALRPISAVLDSLPPLARPWRELVAFAARYYQRGLGEVAIAALPPQLRELDARQLARRLARGGAASLAAETPAAAPMVWPAPSAQQTEALAALRSQAGPFLLFGATGSGKTEVYLRAVAELLEHDPRAQALVMVPEINLTPQLEARFRARFAPQWGEHAVVSMHSGMTNPQRLRAWLAAHSGVARIVLGTRMAVFASMPHLRLIVVDEEHDPSYRQQEGARYSARDLAVYRGQREGAKVILGSATPSLESWHHSRPAAGADPGGRYLRLAMPARIGQAPLPVVRCVDMGAQPRGALIAPALVAAIAERVQRGEQAMLLLNRRGYAPVLHCPDCGWKSDCPHCSAHQVFHKSDRTLRCHHCGFTQRVPRACPDCGNLDIAPIGRGTQRLEEQLAAVLAGVLRPDGGPVRIARIDADSTRAKGELERLLAQVHAGEVDVLVGTQMIAKGHDFRRITLVAAVNPDGALFSSDFRAPERLFALLMQAAGRAGRDANFGQGGGPAEMWVQTFFPAHPLFEALRRHDYPTFAHSELAERRAAGLPPFSHQALLRAEARSQEVAQGFLNAARALAQAQLDTNAVSLYGAVPQTVARVANVERAQMLVESASRAALQRFLAAWHEPLRALRASAMHRGLLRWAIDVDPLSI